MTCLWRCLFGWVLLFLSVHGYAADTSLSELYVYAGSALQPFQQPTLPHFKESVYHLPLARDTAYTLYLRIQDVQAPLLILLNLHTSTQMLQQVVREYPLLSFIIGGLITLAFYNLMYFLFILIQRRGITLPSSLTLASLIALGSVLPALLRAMGVIGDYAILHELPYFGLLFALILMSLTQAEQIRHSREQAERIAASNQAKDEFLTTMSHELRTPMNAVVGAGNLLKITPLSGKQAEYVQKLEISSRHMLALINDILDLARADSRLLRLESIPFALEEVLHEIEQLLAEQAHKKQLALTLDNLFQPADKPLLVGDPSETGIAKPAKQRHQVYGAGACHAEHYAPATQRRCRHPAICGQR